LIIALRPASNVSTIFRTRTSSTVYNIYIVMREGMGQPG